MLFPSVLTCLIPYSAYISYQVLIAIRITSGLFHGVIFAALRTLWTKWIPENERGVLIGFANTGMNIGNVIIFMNNFN